MGVRYISLALPVDQRLSRVHSVLFNASHSTVPSCSLSMLSSHLLQSKYGSQIEVAPLTTNRDYQDAYKWVETFKDLRFRGDVGCDDRQPLKIAILDSGIDLSHPDVKDALDDGRILGYTSFVNDSDIQDRCGHGTHIAGLLLDLAENIRIYVAKIMDTAEAEGEAVRQNIVQVATYLKAQAHWGNMADRKQALKYLQTEWEVDIISLSFGYNEPGVPDEVGREIEKCLDRKIPVFASASNDGGYTPRTYPGNYPGVICIHSSTADGKRSTFSPNPEMDKDNFMVNGECIESWWPSSVAIGQSKASRQSNHLSGTSFATPIAVSIAAFMIGYIRKHFPRHTWNIDPMSPEGMRRIFRQMRHLADGYDLVSPQWFFREFGGEQIRANLAHHRKGLGGENLLTQPV